MNIKRYILPVFLSFSCILSACSHSNSSSGNNTTQKEENPTLEGI